MTRSRSTCIGMVILALALGSCASMGRSKAMETERLLMAAGFQMRLADSDEKLAQLQKLPQRTLAPRNHEGRPVFLYADAKFCKCLYVGTEQADRRFERMSLVKGLVTQRERIAADRADAAMNLSAWGPWGPWW
jgi:hypothetical protein